MSQQKVTNILDEAIKTGQNDKGEWSMALVELENGKEAKIFQPIAIGDVCESYQYENNGQTYWGWRKARQDVSQASSLTSGDLQAIHDKLDRIIEAVGA